MYAVETVLLLVVIATVVAMSAQRLRLPAPSLLVVAGVLVGLLPGVPDIQISPEIVSLVVLPPLLYAAGEDLSARELRAVWRPVTILAIGLVAASAAAVGAVAVAVTPLSAPMAFVLGAILASTDPVAVTALGRRLPLPPRVQTLIQAESLFNDATSLVLFRVAAAAAVAGGFASWQWAAGQLLLVGGGGMLVGAVVAAGVALIRSRTEDPVLETVISLVTPYAAFVVAESLRVSGVTSVVVASVILGSLAPRLTNPYIRLQLHAVYGTVVFLLESVIFGLIGLMLPTLIADLGGAVADLPLQVLVITATMLAVRLLWVFPLSAAMRVPGTARRIWPVPVVVTWAGARGVVPLAAALSIPLLPQRNLALTLTVAVIVLTLTVQGFTLAPLVRRSGVAVAADQASIEYAAAREQMSRAALARLDELDSAGALPGTVSDRLRGNLGGDDPVYRAVRRELIDVQSARLEELHREGTITEGSRRHLQRGLDLEHTSLEE